MSKVIHESSKQKPIHQYIFSSTKLFLPLLGITSITAVSTIALTSPLSSALDTKSVGASVRVAEACSITASDSGTATPDNPYEIIGGTYAPSVKTVTMDIYCNDKNGYSLYAVGYGYNSEGIATEGITTMNSSTPGSTNTIPTGTDTSTDVSNWSFKLSPVSGTFAPSILSDSAGSFSNYHAIPDHQTKVATFTDTIDVTTASTLTSTYAVAVSPYQTPDVYTGQVKYTLVHPNYTNADGTTESYPVTLSLTNADSIVIDGTTYTSASATPNLTYGEHTISGTFPENYEFDNWSVSGDITIADASSSSTSINVTGSGTLTLNAKSKLWFQNATMADCGKTMYDNRGNDTYKNIAYTTAKIGDLCWMTRNLDLPGGTTLSQSDSNLNGSTTSYTLRASSTSGFDDYTTGWVYNSSSTYNDTSCGDNNPCYSYYSAVAATAGTNPSSGDASSDICPYGWRLPTNSEMGSITSQVSTFSPVYSGYYSYGQFSSGDYYGRWWSATAINASTQYSLYYLNGSLATNDVYKYRGFSVRCVKSS